MHAQEQVKNVLGAKKLPVYRGGGQHEAMWPNSWQRVRQRGRGVGSRSGQ